MTLDELIRLVGNRADYNPNTDAYIDDVTRLVNDSYLPFCAQHPWLWAQKEVDVTAHADIAATLSAVTATKNIATPAATFLAWMEGQIIEIGGAEYEITQVDSTTSAWIDTAVTTSTGDAATIKQRYVDLPQDCVDVLGVSEMQRTAGTETRGIMFPLARAEGELYGLDFAQTGAPTRWMPADPFALPPPVKSGALSTTAGTAWTAGVYKFRLGFVYAGRFSEPSYEELTHTAVSTSAVVPVLTIPSTGAGSGYLHAIWCKPPGYKAYRLYSTGHPETGGAITLTTSPSTAWASPSRRRAPESGGLTPRLRFWPRTDTDRTYTVRYLRRVPRLLELSDTPAIPEPHQSMAALLALASVHEKKGEALPVSLQSQIGTTYLALTRRYLTPTARRIVKGGWTDGIAGGAAQSPLVHLG